MSSERGERIRYAIGLAGILMFIAIAGMNLRLAALIAARDGKTLGEVWQLWLAGYEAGATYSGRTVMAIDRIETALLFLGVLLLLGAWVYSVRAIRRGLQKQD